MHKSPLTIAAMREGIRLGYKFPAVDITRSEDRAYQLLIRAGYVVPENYGGHHRALSHLIGGAELSFNLWDTHVAPSAKRIKFKPIREISMDASENIVQLRNALRHLPYSIAKEFCYENGVELNRYLLQQSL